MKIYLLSILITLAMLQYGNCSSQQVEDEKPLPQSMVDCVVRTLIADLGDHDDAVSYECITYPDEEEDGLEEMVYSLPHWIINKLRSALEAQPTTYLRIHGASLSRDTLKKPKKSNLRHEGTPHRLEQSLVIAPERTSVLEFSETPFPSRSNEHEGERRHLLPSKTGYNTLLMVRVQTNDGTVSLASDALSERAFGSVGTVESTYEECSSGKLKIQQASGSDKIVKGVTEISVDANIVGSSIRAFENTLISALQTHVGNLDRFDHLAFCVPKGSFFSAGMDGWVGYGYIDARTSYFNDENCGHLSKLVHELGHNLGLGHSGRDGISNYADQSGIMSWGHSQAAWPIRCFNAAKNWQLGWFNDKSVTVDVKVGAWAGRLYGYVEYAEVTTGTVLINVGDIYIQYNRISSANRDTFENVNQVTVVRSGMASNSISSALAGLDKETTSFQIPRFVDSAALVIEVCDHTQGTLDYYEISIRLSNQQSNCGSLGYAIQPTAPPTATPTTLQTLSTKIVANPSPVPTPAPTPFPTSKRPTLYPTTKPVPAPTRPPTPWPSLLPTVPPTPTPTPGPTLAPAVPSPDPTMVPSQIPSDLPSAIDSKMPTLSITPSELPTSNSTCDDHPFATFPTDEENGYKRCIWLAARPDAQKQFCVPNHPAYKICEETCGFCTDNCEDTNETFVYNGVARPCSWLSIRFNVQTMVCVDGNDANTVCPETCGSCDR